MAVLLISHDLRAAASMADRILIMKEGKIVEDAPAAELFEEPKHVYTKQLLLDMKKGEKPFEMTAGCEKKEPLLEMMHVSKVYKDFKISSFGKNQLKEAVKDVSLTLYKGEIFGLVGESGCGKSTLANMIAGILPADAGMIRFHGETLHSLEEGRKREQIRRIQMVFQDCTGSLDPRWTIRQSVAEPLSFAADTQKDERLWKAEKLLLKMGLTREETDRLPKDLSGGQRQRAVIARALMSEPELLILDEPVSALDVSVQEQILKQLFALQQERRLTYLFISHDLQVIRRMSRRAAVMFAGEIVESGSTEELYKAPWHPYTKALLLAVLPSDRKKARKKRTEILLEEKEPAGQEGCVYAARCGYCMACCREEKPELYTYETRKIRCFLYSEKHTARRDDKYRMTSQI